jgi:hypothetical protein
MKGQLQHKLVQWSCSSDGNRKKIAQRASETSKSDFFQLFIPVISPSSATEDSSGIHEGWKFNNLSAVIVIGL